MYVLLGNVNVLCIQDVLHVKNLRVIEIAIPSDSHQDLIGKYQSSSSNHQPGEPPTTIFLFFFS
jgi:hypothetical protein